jgi:AcrR family transcriptional regulator
MDRAPRGTARRKLLDAAAARFYAQGVAATGIDVITADAGVAKMSLYNNFASKAELVAAYLERRQEEFRVLQRELVAALPDDAGPGARALTVFDAYVQHAASAEEAAGEFRGCGLLNAAGELASGDPARDAVARHKAEVEQMLRDALDDGTHDDSTHDDSTHAEDLAEHLSLLLEGSMARSGLDGDTARLHRARALAARLLGEPQEDGRSPARRR